MGDGLDVTTELEPRVFERSEAAMRRARRTLTRGVASGARLRRTSTSLQFRAADGSTVTDVDGNEYIDFVLGLGPALLGHRPPEVLAAARVALESAVLFGGQQEDEARLAELLVEVVPAAEIVSLCVTGSEAVHFALRVAQVKTSRRRIVKFGGHYHGWVEPVFVNTPWVPATAALPTAPTHAVAGLPGPSEVTVARWNSLDSLEEALFSGPPVAAVIMEPIPCNAGVIEPSPGYLEGARELCDAAGAALVFDEVLSGFRMALGGAQERFGVTPDLTILSKAIASGFPMSAVVGSAEWMQPAVDGPVMPAGTYSGFPASVAASIATIEALRAREDFYPHLERLGALLEAKIAAAAALADVPLRVNRIGSALQLLWGVSGPITEYADIAAHDRQQVAELTTSLLPYGIHAPERGLLLLCGEHTEKQMTEVGAAFESALAEVARRGNGEGVA